jgi:hypothetical protein
VKRKTPLKRGKRPKPKNVKRASGNWLRAFGSKERVAFVRNLPCIVLTCGNTPSENAHIESGGMGWKAHHTKVVPLCSSHHRYAHQHGIKTFTETFNLPCSLETYALLTQGAWLAHLDHTIQTTP